ncbi:MAG: hypothetical protein RIC51_04625 [Erythrobacter sp.]
MRAHLATYAEEDLERILAGTTRTEAMIREHEIADMAGGSRPASYLFASSVPGGSGRDLPTGSHRLGIAIALLMRERENKLANMRRKGEPTYRIYFSNIDLPGDDPNKNAVR